MLSWLDLDGAEGEAVIEAEDTLEVAVEPEAAVEEAPTAEVAEVEAPAAEETKTASADDDEFRVSDEEIAHAAEHGMEVEGLDFGLSDDPDALLSWLDLDGGEGEAVLEAEDTLEVAVEPEAAVEEAPMAEVAAVEAEVEAPAAEETKAASADDDEFRVTDEEIAHAAEHGMEIEGLDFGDDPESLMSWLELDDDEELAVQEEVQDAVAELEFPQLVETADDQAAQDELVEEIEELELGELEVEDVDLEGIEGEESLTWLDDLAVDEEPGVGEAIPTLEGELPVEGGIDTIFEEAKEDIEGETPSPLDAILADDFDDDEDSDEDLGWLDNLTPMEIDDVLDLDSDVMNAKGIDTVFPDLPTLDEALETDDQELVRSEIGELPEDPDEALAILEQLAASQRDEEVETVEPEDPNAALWADSALDEIEEVFGADFEGEADEIASIVEDEDLPVPTIIQDVSDMLPEWLEETDEDEGLLDWLDKDDQTDGLDWLQAEEQASQVTSSLSAPRTGQLPDVAIDSPDPSGGETIDLPADEIGEVAAEIELDPNLFALPREALSQSDIDGAIDGYSAILRNGKHIDQLIVELEQQLNSKNRHPFLMRLLGDAYMQEGQLQKALDIYSRVQDLL